MDGHLPEIKQPGANTDTNRCEIDLEQCFSSAFWTRHEEVAPEEMFKRFAFQQPKCGDCMIMALVTASGPLGLKTFFPEKGATFLNKPLHPMEARRSYPKYLPPPHLPLTPTWEDADFSLESVLRTTSMPGEEVDLRQWCMRLLSRYQYLSGRSHYQFHMLFNPDQAKNVFNSIDKTPGVSILGMNDDINNRYEVVRGMMGEWFEKRWPLKAYWEH